jgi:glycosyltransferase involved in cell wall biosynthesis
MDFNSEPLISIIIPCYNSEKYIIDTLKSLTEQSYKKIQIVCINDGSTDGTQALIEKLSRSDSRIELVNKENGGIESALKEGVNFLKGDYTFLIGHDDTLSKDAMAEALNAFKNNTNLDAVRPDLNFVFEDSSKNHLMQDRRVLNGKEAFLETIGQWKIHTFCLWRTSVFRKINEVDTKGSMNFDELATRYLYLKCRAVGYCDGVYNYFQHSQSITKKVSVKRFQVLTTDTLLRQLLFKAELYKAVSNKFEQYALNNIIHLANLYFSMKNLSRKDKIYTLSLMEHAFFELNKNLVLNSFSDKKKKAWAVILSSFKLFIFYLRVKYVYYKTKGRTIKAAQNP